MQAVRFDKQSHWDDIQEWFRHYGFTIPDGWLPTVGYVVPGVAAAWIYFTDSDVAMIESVISNPDSTKEDRDSALDAIEDEMCKTAKSAGSKWLIGVSSSKAVLGRAEKRGYFVIPCPAYQVIKKLD